MKTTAIQIAEQRAISLAKVLLTRNPDVLVMPHSGADQGIDLHVSLRKGGVFSGCVFGVELKARVNTKQLGLAIGPDRIKIASSFRAMLEKHRERIADYPFPVLLLAFTMETDHGYFSWLRDPRAASLKTSTPEYLTQWGPETHLELIDTVREWYDLSKRKRT